MAIRLLPGEDRTGEVWYPFSFDPSQEAFVVTGPPSVTVSYPTKKRTLVHPVVHLRSGLPSVRKETSRPGWIRNYVPMNP